MTREEYILRNEANGHFHILHQQSIPVDVDPCGRGTPRTVPLPLASRCRKRGNSILINLAVPERVLPAHDSATAEKALRLCGASSSGVLATCIRHVAEKSQHAMPARFSSHLSYLEVIDAWSQEDHEIVRHLAQGCTNRNIAQHVYRSESSVKKKLHSLMASLGCQRRSQLAACYAQYEAQKGLW